MATSARGARADARASGCASRPEDPVVVAPARSARLLASAIRALLGGRVCADPRAARRGHAPDADVEARRKPHFEPLEPRLLLSADLLPGFDDVALAQGADALEAFGDRLTIAGVLGEALPMVDLSAGALLGADELFQRVLTDPLRSYLGGSRVPGSAALEAALEGAHGDIGGDGVDLGGGITLRGLSVVDESVAPDADSQGEVRLKVAFSATRLATLDFELAGVFMDADVPVAGEFQVPVEVAFGFDAHLGVDRTDPSAGNAFYLEFNRAADNQNFIRVEATADDVSFATRIGFLGVEISGGTLALGMDLGIGAAPGDPRVGAEDLASLAADAIFPLVAGKDGAGVDVASTFSLVLPVDVAGGGISLPQGTLTVDDTDLLDGATSMLDATQALGAMGDFGALSADAVLGVLEQLGELVDGLGAGGAFDQSIPFAGGATLGDLLDPAGAFRAEVLSRIAGDDDGGTSAFTTAQELAARLASAVSYTPDLDGDGDGADRALLVSIDFRHVFDLFETPLGFDFDLGPIGSIDTASVLSLEAELGGEFELGVLLSRPGFTIDGTTPLAELNRNLGVFTRAGDDGGGDYDPARFRIALSDGDAVIVDLAALLAPASAVADLTVADLLAAVGARIAAHPDKLPGGGDKVSFGFNADMTGFALVDHTFDADAASEADDVADDVFKLAGIEGSLTAVLLGIAGTGEDGTLDGKPLHGETLFDKAFIRQVPDAAMLSGTLRLIASDIDAAARFGFLEVEIVAGQAVGSITAELSLGDPGTLDASGARVFDGIVTFQEGFDLVEQFATRVVSDPVQLPSSAAESFGGVLALTVGEPGAAPLLIPFYVPASLGLDAGDERPTDAKGLATLEARQMALVAFQLDESIRAVLDRVAPGQTPRISAGHDGDQLTFTLTDGIARNLRVETATVAALQGEIGNAGIDAVLARLAGIAGMPAGAGLSRSLLEAGDVARLGVTTLFAYVARPRVSGSVEARLPVSIGAGIPGLERFVDLDPITVSITDIGRGDFSPPDRALSAFELPDPLSLDLGDFGFDGLGGANPLQRLHELSFVDIVAMVDGGVSYLQSLAEQGDLDFLNADLPLLDVNLSDVLDLAGAFGDVAAQFAVSPVDGLGAVERAFEELLGIADDAADAVSLALVFGDGADGIAGNDDDSVDAVRLDLDLAAVLGLTTATQVPIVLDLGDSLPELVDVSGAGMVSVEAGAAVVLSLGLDLTGDGFIRPFLFDFDDADGSGTRVTVSAGAEASGLAFNASVGPLGVRIGDGVVRLGSKTDPDAPARLSVGLVGGDGGRHYLDALFGGPGAPPLALQLDLDAHASADFDVSFPGLPVASQAVGVDVAFTDAGGGLISPSLTVTGAGAFTNARDGLRDDFNLLAMVGGWEGAFDLLIDAMEGEVFGLDIPLVGDALADQATFLRDIKNEVLSNFRGAEDDIANDSGFAVVRSALFDALGPGGLDLLRDLNADGDVTSGDVVVSFDPMDTGFVFELRLGQDLLDLDLPVDFDLGIPGFSLDVDAPVTAKLGFDLGLALGVNVTDGFYLDTDRTGLDVMLDISVPGLAAQGELFFLRANVADLPSVTLGDGAPADARFSITARNPGASLVGVDVGFVADAGLPAGQERVVYDAVARSLVFTVNPGLTTAADLVALVEADAAVAALFTAVLDVDGLIGPQTLADGAALLASGFRGAITVDLLEPSGDGKLTLAEIFAADGFGDVVDFQVDGAADLNFRVLGSFGGTAKLPSIRSDLLLDWTFALGDAVEAPSVSFSRVELNLGEFLTDFAGGVLGGVQDVLDPIRPVLEVLTDPLPVISDLAGEDLSLIDVAKLWGGQAAGAARFVEALAQVDDFITTIPDLGPDTWIDLGGFSLGDDGAIVDVTAPQADLQQTVAGLGQAANPRFDADMLFKSAPPASSSAGKFSGRSSALAIGFPILSNPTSAFGLLTGQTVELFALELPTFEFGVQFSRYFPIPPFPILGATIGGRASATIDLAFGYDTHGIEQYKVSGDVVDIFDGFYVFDHERADGGGADIPELRLDASLTAAASLNAGLLSASVGGGIFAGIDFNLNDPDDDGKVRAGELADNFALGPIHVFDVSGDISAGLFASLTVDLFFTSYTERFNLAEVTLLDFEIERPTVPSFDLGAQNGGQLSLLIGPDAHLRSSAGNNVDGDESIQILPGASPDSVVLKGFGAEQVFEGVTLITGDAGAGNDRVEVFDGVSIPVWLSGGAGNDVLIGGGGADLLAGDGDDDVLEGRGGDDVLRGGIGRDVLRGGDDDDVLEGGTGADLLDGGQGADRLRGGDDADRLLGGAGDDTLDGELGADTLEGGEGADLLRGGDGDDVLDGGRDADRLFGGVGRDSLSGGDGADELHGGADADVLRGGRGNDVLFGDGAADVLLGEEGRDTLWGGDGDDLLLGGLAQDELFGGKGDDTLYANDQAGSPDEGAHRLVGGAGADRIFSATGETGLLDDTIFGDGDNDAPGDADPSLDGADVISAYAGADSILGGGGADVIDAGDGDDVVEGGDGADQVHAGAGHDVVRGGAGNDTIYGDAGDDFIAGGVGDDTLRGGGGDDVLIGGFEFASPGEFELGVTGRLDAGRIGSVFVNSALVPGDEVRHRIIPAFLDGASVPGALGDGADRLYGEGDDDLLFGGGDVDELFGGAGRDYVDAGLGGDVVVSGGDGDDVLRGGDGDDQLRGGSGIDLLIGDAGSDRLYGDAGLSRAQAEAEAAAQALRDGITDPAVVAALADALDGAQDGQRLFGGAGGDFLFAFAPDATSAQFALVGDELHGGDDGDFLYGNLRSELLDGGGGKDVLIGDSLAGPDYATNALVDTAGGVDTLLGGSGQDQLFGGFGDDILWGGADGDLLDGQRGDDTEHGGGGVDFFVLYTGIGAEDDVDVLRGHTGNAAEGDVADDNATDILVITGTSRSDVILLSADAADPDRVVIDYQDGIDDRVLRAEWRDGATLHIEQFQIAGLGGDDTLGFVTADIPAGANPVPGAIPLDVAALAKRPDFALRVDGNGGDDTLFGGAARDRLDGGPGSDTLYGFGGDDQLWGDLGDGASGDRDTLFAGQGNDDLMGGAGRNTLHAWSRDPSAGAQFGVFVDPRTGALFDDSGDFEGALDAAGQPIGDGKLDSDPALPARAVEATGLNRIIGGAGDDALFGGTVVDFMFGNGGNDMLYRADGSSFESLDGGQVAGDEWKQYARESDAVWYVGGTNASDEIRVDFVTEPGLLADHHLVTRLTENEGLFSFAADVRLDFDATDADGNRIWSPEQVVYDFAALRNAKDAEARGDALAASVENATDNLFASLLPPEGDFLVILIDALGGDDRIFVGPTVQKTVWVDAGAGDDRVEIRSGNAILVDRAEQAEPAGGLRGRNDIASQAFELGTIASPGASFTGLTIDNPQDVDHFAFRLDADPGAGAVIRVVGASSADRLTLRLEQFGDDPDAPVKVLESEAGVLALEGLELADGERLVLRVESDQRPTAYRLAFALDPAAVGPGPTTDLGLRPDIVRRDVILGGDGDDILLGGAGEDFIFGGSGSDVLSGGADRQAADLLFGGDGDDTFQIIPDALPAQAGGTGGETFVPTFSDQLIGGDGDDRVLYLGGDLDRRGLPVPDFAALRYDSGLHRYELSSLVWDIGAQAFRTTSTADGPTRYVQHYAFYQARDVERTAVNLRSGDDVFHADAGFRFLPLLRDGTTLTVDGGANPALLEEWGIVPGDLEQGARAAELTVLGGPGKDALFGGAYDDTLDGGDGADLIVGGPGNDRIEGRSGADTLYGNEPATPLPALPYIGSAQADQGFREVYRYGLAAPFQSVELDARAGIDAGTATDAVTIDAAFGLVGSQLDGETRGLRSLGDINLDGFDDFLLSGDDRSYLLLGPVDLDGLRNVTEVAVKVFDHGALGQPAERFGDIDGDGRVEIAFLRLDGAAGDQDAVVTAIASTRLFPLGTVTDAVFGADAVVTDFSYVYRIQDVVNDVWTPSDGLNLHLLDVGTFGVNNVKLADSPDGKAELLLTPDDNLGPASPFGRLYTTADLTVGVEFARAASVRIGSVGGYIADDVSWIVPGDVDGDGLDEVFWIDESGQARLHSGASGNDVLVVAGPSASFGAVPVVLGDVDGDGYDDFGIATEYGLFVYRGLADLDALEGAAPDLVVLGPDLSYGTASITSGDFDRDGTLDIVLAGAEVRDPVHGEGNAYVFRGLDGGGPAGSTLMSTASMNAPHGAHTATVLDDGRVLVVGGNDVGGDNSAQRVEIYDPVRNTWSVAAPLEVTRSQHAATLLDDGRVLVSGGWDNDFDPLASGEIYDPVADAWTLIDDLLPGGGLFQHATVRLADGRVLFTGGIDGAFDTLATVRAYDVDSGDWTTLTPMTTDRQQHTATVLADGRVVVVGGADTNLGDAVSPMEIFTFDAATGGAWTGAADFPFAWRGTDHSTVLLADGRLLVMGGFDPNDGFERSAQAEIYDLASGTQTELSMRLLPIAMAEFGAVALDDGRVMVTGGNDIDGNTRQGAFTLQTLASADLVIAGADDGAIGGRSVVDPAMDLDGDGVDDLVVGGAQVAAQDAAEVGVSGGGALYVMYGSPNVDVPRPGEIVDLSNVSIPGAGSFVADRATGLAETFFDADGAFLLPVGGEGWFRFTTLGDGSEGDVIRLDTPGGPAGVLVADLFDERFGLLLADVGAVDLRNFEAGTYLLRVKERPGAYPRVVAAQTAPQALPAGAATTRSTLSVGDAGTLVDLDVSLTLSPTSDSNLAVVLESPAGTRVTLFDRKAFIGGVFTGTVLDDEALIGITGRYGAPGSFRPEGVLGAFDGEDFAGDWVLEITESAADGSGVLGDWALLARLGQPTPYTVSIEAPLAGARSETLYFPDRDVIRGGDGADRLHGNHDLDVLFGEGGEDVFVGQGIEARDFVAALGDRRIDGPQAEHVNNRPRIGGVDGVLLDPDPVVEILGAGALYIAGGDTGFAEAVAAAAGFPVTFSLGGEPIIHGELRESVLAGITVLDASDLDLDEGGGALTLEALANLQVLHLDGNRLTDLTPVESLDDLRVLTVTGNAAVLDPFAVDWSSVPRLERLELDLVTGDGSGVTAIRAGGVDTAGNLVVTEEREVVVELSSPGPFALAGEDRAGNPLAPTTGSGDTVTFTPTTPGIYRLTHTATASATATPSLPIVDFQTTPSTLTVVDAGRVTDLNVSLSLVHAYGAALRVTLTSPTGVEVVLVDQNELPSGPTTLSGTTLDDEAATSIAGATGLVNGTFRVSNPAAMLDSFDTLEFAGDWVLRVTDTDGEGDTGTLQSWTLSAALERDLPIVVRNASPAIGDTAIASLPDGPVTEGTPVALDALVDVLVAENAGDTTIRLELTDRNGASADLTDSSLQFRDGARVLVADDDRLDVRDGVTVEAWVKLDALPGAGGTAAIVSRVGTASVAAADPEVARQLHSASVLPDGRVLVMGGASPESAFSAEIYDPATDTWAPAQALTEAGAIGSTGTVLADGRVLVAGGFENGLGYSDDAEIYDPVSGTWTLSDAARSLATARYLHAAAPLGDGGVLLVGGLTAGNTPLRSGEVFDPDTESWSLVANLLPAARYNAAMALLADGRVLVAGGSVTGGTSRDVGIYDPDGPPGNWLDVAPMLVGRQEHTVTTLPDGRVLVLGGSGPGAGDSAEIYDPATDTWSAVDGLQIARARHAAAPLPDGRILVSGGGSAAADSAEIYNLERDDFRLELVVDDRGRPEFRVGGLTVVGDAGHALAPGQWHHVAASFDRNTGVGAIVVDGEVAGAQSLNAAAWAPTGALQSGHSAFTLLADGRVLATGSGDATAEVYDPDTGLWSAAGDMLVRRAGHTATAIDGGTVLVAGGRDRDVAGDSFVRSTELYDASTGLWSAASDMLTARIGHTATSVAGGKVLVVGGTGELGGPLRGAEIYDPQTGLWSATGDMATPRTGHKALPLGDGRVLVVGDNDVSVEIYEPATGQWSAAGELSIARADFTATLLSDGRVLVTGGFASSSAEIYDPATDSWSAVADLAQARAQHASTLLSDGRVLVTGGYDQDFNFLDSAEILDPETGTWTSVKLLGAHFAHTVTLLADGSVLLVDATSAERSGAAVPATSFAPMVFGASGDAASTASLDGAIGEVRLWDTVRTADAIDAGRASLMFAPADGLTGLWRFNEALGDIARDSASGNDGVLQGAGGASAGAPAWTDASAHGGWVSARTPDERVDHTASTLDDHRVLVAGGRDAGGDLLSTARVFDPATGVWTAAATLVDARDGHTATVLDDGRVLVIGGNGAGGVLRSAEIYDPVTGTWSAAHDLAGERVHHTATLLPGGLVLVTGGFDDNYDPTRSAEIYDPDADAWTSLADMFAVRVYHTATWLGGDRVLVTGGYDAALSPSRTAQIFDLSDNAWTGVTSMASERDNHTATLLPDGSVLVVGGNALDGGVVATVERFHPGPRTWTTEADLPTPRADHAAVRLDDGRVVVAGGVDASFDVTPGTVIFDPDSGAWSRVGELTLARAQHAAVLLDDGRVMVTGGRDGGFVALASAELLDPATASDAITIPGTDSSVLAFPTADENLYTLTIELVDDEGDTAKRQRQVAIVNADPVAVMASTRVAGGGDVRTVLASDASPQVAGAGSAIRLDARDSADPGLLDALAYRWQVTWHWQDIGPGVDVTPADHTGDSLTFTPQHAGSYRVELRVSDGDGGTDSVVRTFAAAPAGALALPAGAPYLEGDVLSFALDPMLTTPLPPADVEAGFPGAERSYDWNVYTSSALVASGAGPGLAFVPPGDDDYLVELYFTDRDLAGNVLGTGAVAEWLQVGNADPAFRSAIAPGPVRVDEGGAVTLDGRARDPGSADVLTYGWTASDPAVTVTPAADGRTAVVSGGEDGTYTVDLTVDDGDGGVIARSFTVIVGNVAPTVDDPCAEGIEGTTVVLALTASDPGASDVLSFQWAVRNPDGTPLLDAMDTPVSGTGPDVSFAATVSGLYLVDVTVTDDDGGESTRTLHIDVANVAPVVTAPAGPATVDEGQVFGFSGTVSDAGGAAEPLEVSVDFGDGVVLPVLLRADGGFDTSHLYAESGDYVVTVIAADESDETRESFDITVANLAPTATLVPRAPLVAGEDGTLTLRARDPGARDTHTFAWQVKDAGGADVPGAAGAGPSVPFMAASSGAFSVQVTVTDDEGAVGNASLPFQVVAASIAGDASPVAVNDVYTIDEDQVLVVNAAAGVLANDSDADTPAASLTATLLAAPAHGAVTLDPLGSFTYTPVANFAGTDTFTYRVSDGVHPATGTVRVTVNPLADELRVTSVSPGVSGLTVFFDGPVDSAPLNLYDAGDGGFGAADLVLTGDAQGPIVGSLVIDDQRAIFVATGGPLAPDTYTLTLRGGDGGFRATNGVRLDGDDDGVAGDDYATTFTVAASDARLLSVPDFARGPGQPVDVPADGAGLPITLDDTAGMESLDFTILYDPALLTVTGALRGADLPANAALEINTTSPGVAVVAIALPTPMSAGAAELVRLEAVVPDGAPYAGKHVLDVTGVRINEGAIAARGDDALHVAGYLGDTTANGEVSSLDGQRVLRVAVGLDTGFAGYRLADPRILADVTGDGTLSALDAARLLQEATGIDRPEIPALPAGALPFVPGGLDPMVTVPGNLSANRGETITVPVRVDTIPAGLDGVALRLAYDPAVLELLDVMRGDVTAGFSVFHAEDGGGVLELDASNGRLIDAIDGGTLAEITFLVRGDAAPGDTVLDLQDVRLNDGRYTLLPLPQPGPDASDGAIVVGGPVRGDAAGEAAVAGASAFAGVPGAVASATGVPALAAPEVRPADPAPLAAVARAARTDAGRDDSRTGLRERIAELFRARSAAVVGPLQWPGGTDGEGPIGSPVHVAAPGVSNAVWPVVSPLPGHGPAPVDWRVQWVTDPAALGDAPAPAAGLSVALPRDEDR